MDDDAPAPPRRAWMGRPGPDDTADGRGPSTGWALPAGHPVTWGAIVAGTVLEDSPYG